ncbi:FCD domain-containing protein [Neoasaia chiangmaiensis]|uniref:HTH gntR-type domain-containing protein n=1 Tax=Neoasaia chiangmaiensis TaxID=320497 RepID=A0A1U9KLK8_9PROT|nr:FCD domain-containing protein [Neoasaia chiangmaiensis]AQS86681.1 hypothetical protein A0U93_00520 [Neoasaia chiangmaiensis]
MSRLAAMKIPRAQKIGLAQYTEDCLKRELLEGRLRPSDRLVTRELAELLGTSITPVREALLRLAAIGVLEALPAQSFMVPFLSSARYRELSDIRKAVEPLAASRAMHNMTAKRLNELRAIQESFQEAKRRGQVAQALAFNHSFRFALYATAEMPDLLEVIENLWLKIGPTLNFLFPQGDLSSTDSHNYDRLIAVFETGDEAAVREIVSNSIEEGTRIIVTNLEKAAALAEPATA